MDTAMDCPNAIRRTKTRETNKRVTVLPNLLPSQSLHKAENEKSEVQEHEQSPYGNGEVGKKHADLETGGNGKETELRERDSPEDDGEDKKASDQAHPQAQRKLEAGSHSMGEKIDIEMLPILKCKTRGEKSHPDHEITGCLLGPWGRDFKHIAKQDLGHSQQEDRSAGYDTDPFRPEVNLVYHPCKKGIDHESSQRRDGAGGEDNTPSYTR